ncbi:MAG TPA: TetR/AcrR family transcriptional regulator [Limnobacter sp.]|nr:TetR/AcrR family transcriptional regulator [Limnobacter sp.]
MQHLTFTSASVRERIIDAGIALFSSQGFRHTTIKQLCKTAQCDRQQFLGVFDSKLSLLKLIHDGIVANAYQKASAALFAFTLEQRGFAIRGAIDAFLDAYLSDPRHAQIACVEIVGIHPSLEKQRRTNLKLFGQLLMGYARRSRLQQSPISKHSDNTGLILAAGLNELMVDWLQSANRSDISTLREEFQTVIQNCLFGPVESDH